MTVRTYLVVAAVIFVSSQTVRASDDSSYVFLRGTDVGSMSTVAPWNLVINGAFDIIQLDGKDRRILKKPYGIGFRNVWDNVTQPGDVIQRIGFWKWMRTEVLPLDVSTEGAQWLPNYQLHLLGGGMSWKLYEEWYRSHGVDGAGWWSAATVMTMHVLNEVVENEDYVGPNSDPIADLLIFDWLGIVLFMNDDVSEFFGRTLNMRDWSAMPMITFPNIELRHNGLNYALQWDIPGTERWHLFYYMGMSNMAGVGYRYDNHHRLTVAAGARGRTLREINPEVRLFTLNLVPTAGIFLDRNRSLLASLAVSPQHDQTAVLQLYPGLIGEDIFPPALRPGFWAMIGSGGTWGIGCSINWWPGVGISR